MTFIWFHVWYRSDFDIANWWCFLFCWKTLLNTWEWGIKWAVQSEMNVNFCDKKIWVISPTKCSPTPQLIFQVLQQMIHHGKGIKHTPPCHLWNAQHPYCWMCFFTWIYTNELQIYTLANVLSVVITFILQDNLSLSSHLHLNNNLRKTDSLSLHFPCCLSVNK